MFLTAVDIANRALQYLGSVRIAAFSDSSRQATEINFCYDKLRRAELRRRPWRFATRRATLRALTLTTRRYVAPGWVTSNPYVIGQVVQGTTNPAVEESVTTGEYWICAVAHTSSASIYPGSSTPGQPQYWQQYFGPLYGDLYAAGTTYYAGEIAYYKDGGGGTGNTFVMSLVNNNTGNPVQTSPNQWSGIGTHIDQAPFFPVAAGPGVTLASKTRNLFPLPNGFLRAREPDPKVAATETPATSAGLRAQDLQFEDNYIVSALAGPIPFRFVADVTDATRMDEMFCEGLALRLALSICEALTQSHTKLADIVQLYKLFIADAGRVNWLEIGSTEPNDEEYEVTKQPAGSVYQPGKQG